jgi:hypothetical protein
MYIVGLNLTPHDLSARVRRAYALPANTRLDIERVRPLHFPHSGTVATKGALGASVCGMWDVWDVGLWTVDCGTD